MEEGEFIFLPRIRSICATRRHMTIRRVYLNLFPARYN